MRSFNYLTLVLALSACGDDGGATDPSSTTQAASTGGATGSESGGTGESPTSTDASTGGGTGSAPTSGEPGTTSGASTGEVSGTSSTTSSGDTSGGDTSSGDSTTGATSELVIAVVDAELYADCMPEIEPDPAWGSWYVQFDNSSGAAETSAVLTKASLSLADADPPLLEEIGANPGESGPIPAGEQVEQKLEKLKGAAHSACDHCGEFYLLALEYQEGDVIHHVTEDVTISCIF